MTAHGAAERLDLGGRDGDFRDFLRAHTEQTTSAGIWANEPYYRILAECLLAADMSVHVS